ncbi:MAG: 50S ribosomal protein L9 [Phycisphaerae bacterium]|nr:50S ribosomal protein L9 [Phycisphaerae bacterium]
MARSLKLLLVESVDSLGIVGDVVNVRLGYARNFLLPRGLATEPSEELMKSLAAKRAEAERQLAAMRKAREEESAKLTGTELTLIRSCNDQGHLYASVTQQEIATALNGQGFQIVKPRDIRLAQVIKRIDSYDVHVRLDSDLDAIVKLWVVADRKLDLHKDEEPAPAAQGEAKPPKGEPGEPKARKAEGKDEAAEPKGKMAEGEKKKKPGGDKKAKKG